MNVRQFHFLLIFLALTAGSQVLGQEIQSDAAADAEFDDARALLQSGREKIIKDELRMTEDESAAFWPAYKEYQGDLTVVRDRYAVLLTAYLDAYRAGTVSEEFAEQMIDDYLDMQDDLLKIKRKHLGTFRKALPPRKATRFYQLENKIEAQMEAQLSLTIPLIDPV